MASIAEVPHIVRLIENVKEVSHLLKIHGLLAGKGPGRKRNVQILNKSSIVLLVACWEACIEDLVQAALEFMIKNCKDHTCFPPSVLERVASKHAGPKAWDLAGEGWKKALSDNLTEVLAKTIGTLNTPKTDQVNDLFKKALGIDQLSSCWRWKSRTVAQSQAAIDALVTLRGSIAHRVTASEAVWKQDVVDAKDLISRLAAKSSNHVRLFVHQHTGQFPWPTVTFKGTG